MSDLQLALIVIGVLLIAAVFAYNKWQEARYRRQADAALSPSQTDVLLHSTAEPRAFAAAVAEAAGAAGMTAHPGSAEQALAAASRLDALCEQVDIQIVVHVVSRESPFAGTKVRALAEAAGMVLEDDGRFRKR